MPTRWLKITRVRCRWTALFHGAEQEWNGSSELDEKCGIVMLKCPRWSENRKKYTWKKKTAFRRSLNICPAVLSGKKKTWTHRLPSSRTTTSFKKVSLPGKDALPQSNKWQQHGENTVIKNTHKHACGIPTETVILTAGKTISSVGLAQIRLKRVRSHSFNAGVVWISFRVWEGKDRIIAGPDTGNRVQVRPPEIVSPYGKYIFPNIRIKN